MESLAKGVYFHWHSPIKCRVPETAIPADLSRQTPATIPVSHYFDVIRTCEDCQREFLFFAEEQKYWYEELKFPLAIDCIRCVPCRKLQQKFQEIRDRYQELRLLSARTPEQNLQMADYCMALIERGIFGRRQINQMRMLLNRSAELRDDAKYHDIVIRMRVIEARFRADEPE